MSDVFHLALVCVPATRNGPFRRIVPFVHAPPELPGLIKHLLPTQGMQQRLNVPIAVLVTIPRACVPVRMATRALLANDVSLTEKSNQSNCPSSSYSELSE